MVLFLNMMVIEWFYYLPQNLQKTRRLFRSRTVGKTSSLVSTTLKEPEKKAEAKFSSVNYSPTHSLVYMDWLRSYGHK